RHTCPMHSLFVVDRHHLQGIYVHSERIVGTASSSLTASVFYLLSHLRTQKSCFSKLSSD
ncbi:mCG1028051, partial [Mus musculus]